jgi:hypothetical protein
MLNTLNNETSLGNPQDSRVTSRSGWKLGRKHTQETRKKMSHSHLGKTPHNFGVKLSEEGRKKLSEAHTGKPWSPKRREVFEASLRATETNRVFNAKCVRCGISVFKKGGPGNIACEQCRVESRTVARPDRVQCGICGLFFETLLSHVVFKHDLSPKEYQAKFPESSLSFYKQIMSTETRQKISDGQRNNWGAKTPEEKTARKEILKQTYRDGRIPAKANLGRVFSEETLRKMSLSKLGKPSKTKGRKKGPLPLEVRIRISKALKGRPQTISEEGLRRKREKLSRVWTGEPRFVHSGTGKGSYYKTPHQGRVWLRSTSEVQRALELDSEGVVWFYEVEHFMVHLQGKDISYTPDFWIIPGYQLNESFSDPKTFLKRIPPEAVRIEDVKGWWGESHRDRPKIQAFQEQHPSLKFEIVVRKGFVWGVAGAPIRELK